MKSIIWSTVKLTTLFLRFMQKFSILDCGIHKLMLEYYKRTSQRLNVVPPVNQIDVITLQSMHSSFMLFSYSCFFITPAFIQKLAFFRHQLTSAINYIHVNYHNLMMFFRFMEWIVRMKRMRERKRKIKWNCALHH